MKGKVSIIIPLFNRADLIKETLQSLLDQTYINWEAVVVDDGSIDDSIGSVNKFAQIDSRIQLHKRPDTEQKGAPSCRNIGIKASTGEYIIFLDSDDLLAPSCLERRVAEMKKNPNVDFAVFPQLIFNTSPFDKGMLINVFNEKNDLDRFICLYREPDIPWITAAPIWRKKALIDKNHYWDISMPGYQDIEFHLNALLKGFKHIKIQTQPDSFWRIHDHGNIGQSIWKPSRIISYSEFWIRIYQDLKRLHLLTKSRRDSIKRNFSQLVLFFIHRKEFRKADFLIQKIRKEGIIDSTYYAQAKSYLIASRSIPGNNLIKRGCLKTLRILFASNFFQTMPGDFLKHKYQ